jgi:hypothetical protein
MNEKGVDGCSRATKNSYNTVASSHHPQSVTKSTAMNGFIVKISHCDQSIHTTTCCLSTAHSDTKLSVSVAHDLNSAPKKKTMPYMHLRLHEDAPDPIEPQERENKRFRTDQP